MSLAAEAALTAVAPEMALPMKALRFAVRHWKLVLGGLGALLLLVYIGSLKGQVRHEHKFRLAAEEQVNALTGTLRGLVGVVAEVQGVPKLKIEAAPAAVRAIGRDRDTNYSNWQLAKGAVVDQTNHLLEMKRLRDAAIAKNEQARAQVRQLAAQRDAAFRRFQTASTRTERHAAAAELAECRAAMDALYQAGF
jgi:hypothetical protein